MTSATVSRNTSRGGRHQHAVVGEAESVEGGDVEGEVVAVEREGDLAERAIREAAGVDREVAARRGSSTSGGPGSGRCSFAACSSAMAAMAVVSCLALLARIDTATRCSGSTTNVELMVSVLPPCESTGTS